MIPWIDKTKSFIVGTCCIQISKTVNYYSERNAIVIDFSSIDTQTYHPIPPHKPKRKRFSIIQTIEKRNKIKKFNLPFVLNRFNIPLVQRLFNIKRLLWIKSKEFEKFYVVDIQKCNANASMAAFCFLSLNRIYFSKYHFNENTKKKPISIWNWTLFSFIFTFHILGSIDFSLQSKWVMQIISCSNDIWRYNGIAFQLPLITLQFKKFIFFSHDFWQNW